LESNFFAGVEQNRSFNLKVAFSKTRSQSLFPAKNSFVALKVDVVETG
jgi:hypothetical protein